MKCTAENDDWRKGHDWVLVSGRGGVVLEVVVGGKEQLKLLWACPCGEFKWTSYADWEQGEHGRFAGDDNVTEGHAVTVGPKFPRGSRLDEKP